MPIPTPPEGFNAVYAVSTLDAVTVNYHDITHVFTDPDAIQALHDAADAPDIDQAMHGLRQEIEHQLCRIGLLSYYQEAEAYMSPYVYAEWCFANNAEWEHVHAERHTDRYL